MGGYDTTLFAGSTDADQTGTKGRPAALSFLRMFQELYNSGQATIALAAGTYNDINPGSGFPLNIGMVDINVASGIAIVTGMLPGSYHGHRIRIRQTGAGQAQLPTFNTGSFVSNRFLGSVGSLVLGQWQSHDLVYYQTQGWQL